MGCRWEHAQTDGESDFLCTSSSLVLTFLSSCARYDKVRSEGLLKGSYPRLIGFDIFSSFKSSSAPMERRVSTLSTRVLMVTPSCGTLQVSRSSNRRHVLKIEQESVYLRCVYRTSPTLCQGEPGPRLSEGFAVNRRPCRASTHLLHPFSKRKCLHTHTVTSSNPGSNLLPMRTLRRRPRSFSGV